MDPSKYFNCGRDPWSVFTNVSDVCGNPKLWINKTNLIKLSPNTIGKLDSLTKPINIDKKKYSFEMTLYYGYTHFGKQTWLQNIFFQRYWMKIDNLHWMGQMKMDMNWFQRTKKNWKQQNGLIELERKKPISITCSCSGFFVPFNIPRHAADSALQLSPYWDTSGRHTFR